MKPEEIIQQHNLHEVDEASRVRPEATPANLLHTFADHHEVKVYTDDVHKTWLLVSRAERRILLQAPYEA